MSDDTHARDRQVGTHTRTAHWIMPLFGILLAVWLILGLAAIIRFGPLVATYPHYRAVWAILEAVSGLASAYFVLQLPPLRRAPLAWPKLANNIVLAVAYLAWAYEAEAHILGTIPALGNLPVVIAIVGLILSALGIPGRLVTILAGRRSHESAEQAPSHPA